MNSTMTQAARGRKELRRIQNSPAQHWVGDGFPVRTILSHHEHGFEISPFLLLDYGGPVEIAPSEVQRGVDEHPHKGFETVTIVYQGELEHRDSTGNSGRIGPGDVQWMTAASGIVHEEKHGADFSRRGGMLEMAQLWINLPAKDKAAPPGYQTLMKDQIPVVNLPDGGGTVRIIAGEFEGVKGPARTFTPVNVWDMRLNAGYRAELAIPGGYTTALVVLHGEVTLNNSDPAGAGELALFGREGQEIVVEAKEEAVILVLSGEPIDESVVAHGPFVMNSRQEIADAIRDYQIGKMGHL